MRTGRPTKLDAELHGKIVSLVREGQWVDTAARLCGITRQVFYKWLERGQKPKSPKDERYVKFAQDIEDAVAHVEAEQVRLAMERGGKSGAAWWLSRRFPDRFGTRLNAQVTGPQGGPIQHNVGVDPVTLAKRIRRLAGKITTQPGAAPLASSPGADEPGRTEGGSE